MHVNVIIGTVSWHVAFLAVPVLVQSLLLWLWLCNHSCRRCAGAIALAVPRMQPIFVITGEQCIVAGAVSHSGDSWGVAACMGPLKVSNTAAVVVLSCCCCCCCG